MSSAGIPRRLQAWEDVNFYQSCLEATTPGQHGRDLSYGASYDELQPVFDRLSVHADPDLLDELKALPFGVYGHLADRYGVHWFFRGDAEVGT